MRHVFSAAALAFLVSSPALAQCGGDPLSSSPVIAIPAFQEGFSVIEGSLASDKLCFRVQNRKIPRWVDVYVEGITPDGKTVELTQGSLGPPDTHFFSWPGSTDESEDVMVFPPLDGDPVVVPDFSRFEEVRVKCYGLSFDLEDLSEEDFFKFLLASSPTVVFEIADRAIAVITGSKAPKVELRGRPRGNAMRALSEELLKDLRQMNGAEAKALFRLSKNGDTWTFAQALAGEMFGQFKEVYAKNPKLVHDALVELGLDRAHLLKADTLKKLSGLDRLVGLPEAAHGLVQASLAAALSSPVLTFVIKAERPLPILYLIDTSGSMAEGGKMDQVRRSGVASLQQAASGKQEGGSVPVVEVMTFAGECSESSVRTALPFTSDLGKARAIFESGSLRPDGATPLPQAVQAAEQRMA
ncbi:MAG TPA: hypothetical protein VFR31_19340, partial [Thermoanaerobaculia bacterium]|nr:hypothetical protein [Thermoanaerobaculia bacterium]